MGITLRWPRREEIPYILSITVTSFGIAWNFFPLSTSNIIILLGIDSLLVMALQRSSILSRIETCLKKDKFFTGRSKLPSLSERLEKAKKSIWIMSESFGRLIGVDYSLLERKYEEGCEIRILLLNPEKITKRMMSRLDEKSLRAHIETSITLIKKHKSKSEKGGVINGKLLPFEPGFGLFIVDEDYPEGAIKVELMLTGTPPPEWPNVIVTKREGKTYNQFKKHFTKLWELSDPIK